MSFLKTSLEKRIQELRKSIEAQSTELAAYEQVLSSRRENLLGERARHLRPPLSVTRKLAAPKNLLPPALLQVLLSLLPQLLPGQLRNATLAKKECATS